MSPRNTYGFIFSRSVSINFSIAIIQKQQKHSDNKNHKNIFHNKPRSTNRVIPFFLFFFNQISINFNFTLSTFFSLILKNTNQFLICHLAFHFKTFFEINIKTQNQSNENFYPELRGSDPSRVHRQRAPSSSESIKCR